MYLEHIKSNFNKYEIPPGIYTSKDVLEIVHTMGDHGGTSRIEYDDISMKTNFTLTRFGGISGMLTFIERSFFISYLRFTPYWVYKHRNAIHADSLGV